MGHSDFLVRWVSRESLRQQGVSVRIVISLVLCLACFSCTSIERLVRNSPWGPVEERADRVNAWPIYHHNADKTAVLWPVFDHDDRGFALRPLVTREKDDWELLWPLSWWDAETGEELWHISLGALVQAAPITYAVDGQQYVTIAVGNVIYTFGLNE